MGKKILTVSVVEIFEQRDGERDEALSDIDVRYVTNGSP
jgi:hypothetical protein